MRNSKPLVAALALGLAACQTDSIVAPPSSPFEVRAGIAIENSAARLVGRVHNAGGASVGIVSAIPLLMSDIAEANTIAFSLQTTIDAPTVSDVLLPATHIVFRGARAYVSYAPAGERLVGAVDVFDITTPSEPRLISSARFSDSKITTMAVDEKNLYLGTVTSNAAFEATPAVLEVVRLDDDGRLTSLSHRKGVMSHVITGITLFEGDVWVTSGTSSAKPGGITVLDDEDFEVLLTETIADVRAVSSNGRVITVLVGSDAKMRLYNADSRQFISEFSIGGLTAQGHKATIANVANWAFVAAGDSGVVFTRIRQNESTTGTKLISWGNPTAVPDVSEEDAVTNAVAVSGSFAYAANGGSGVWVARGDWSTTAENGTPSIELMGRLDLPGVSSNMVGVYGGSLFVAAGNGGLKVLQQPMP
jgi:hypothetical protein